MKNTATISRRRTLQTLFCSSAALALNLRITARAAVSQDGLNFLCIGDFGTGGAEQQKVAGAMQGFIKKHSLKPDALLCIGDNFYSKDRSPGGFSVDSPRWKTGIEDMYPAASFPCPMYGVLGNHDYHDNEGGQDVQLAYAKRPGVRWKMPAKWYRLDLGGEKPLVTFLCLDTNLPEVSGGKDGKTGKTRGSLTAAESAEQLAWLKAELKKPRAPFTIVMAHHPVYSNGSHSDTKPLVAKWDSLLQENKVHAYLCGHDHDMQHLELKDRFTSHVLSGGGGAKTRALKVTHEDQFANPINGFTHLHVTGEALRFTHFDSDGVQLHTFAKKPDGTVVIGA